VGVFGKESGAVGAFSVGSLEAVVGRRGFLGGARGVRGERAGLGRGGVE